MINFVHKKTALIIALVILSTASGVLEVSNAGEIFE
jgi:hypothetical protein